MAAGAIRKKFPGHDRSSLLASRGTRVTILKNHHLVYLFKARGQRMMFLGSNNLQKGPWGRRSAQRVGEAGFEV